MPTPAELERQQRERLLSQRLQRQRECARCGESKAGSEFYDHPTNGDGLERVCKRCRYKRKRETKRKGTK